ncbi:MAG: hypothetical protein J5882_04240 [Bacteroidales bacterium]|nr:hypothetical protein [Bacteroidales bacterium]
MKNIKYIAALLFIFASFAAQAQFYNGHQMNFGQNRVQYSEFQWFYYRYPQFDTYYYQQGKDLAQYVSDRALEVIPEMEKFFGRKMQKRIIFLVYNRLTEFRQSNIGLQTQDISTNLGGTTKIIDNKVFLYFDGDHIKFDEQIREAVASVLMTSSLYGTGLKSKVANSAVISLPEWYSRGLTAYAAIKWNSEVEDIIKDGFESKKYKKINHLRGDDAKYAGYSLWHYITIAYGRDAVPNIIYLTGINKNLNNAISQALGKSIKKLSPDWKEFYSEKFAVNRPDESIPASDTIIKKPKRNTVYDNPATSPDGRFTFYTTNCMGKYKIFLRDNTTEEFTKLLRREQKLEQITDYSYPVAAWHPTSKILSFVIEERGYVFLYQYNTDSKTMMNKMLPKFDKVYSMDYSPDGLNMVMSVQLSGMRDIVIMNVASGTFENITQDLADDIDPKYAAGSRKIVFASNRLCDTLMEEKPDFHRPIGRTYDIFEYNLSSKNKVLRRVTNSPYENETAPHETSPGNYTYLSDKNGIFNQYASVYDSAIVAIDTIVHYRYTNSYKPVSNYGRNTLKLHTDNKNQKTDKSFRFNDRFYLFSGKSNKSSADIPSTLPITYFKARENRRQHRQDSLEVVRKQRLERERRIADSIAANPPKEWIHPDSLKYDITNYVFEEERPLAQQLTFYHEDLKERHKNEAAVRPHQRLYFTNFYIDYLVSQIDFSGKNQSYQAFTGGPYYFNPGASAYFKIGIKDLFEDYRLTAGVNIGGNFDSYDFYLSFEDLKHRIDKEYIFHRSTFRNINDYWAEKVITNEGMFIASYPFNQTSAIKTTLGLRYDQKDTLVTDYPYLDNKTEYKVFAKAKVEYNFDNTRSLGTNTPSGVRAKAWSEIYQQVEGNYDIISSWGFDFRYYQKIHRSLIFASRLAGATSFGTGKIIYYLGAVDNWTKFKTDGMFDRSIRIDENENYIYQAVATNMRGFIQNCRNGNSFAVLNNEIRWPIFRYLANRPINSKLINDFQVIGFFDAGSAWSGFVPFKNKNAYDKYELQNGSITMTIDVDRPSLVAGYGFGFRTSLLGYFLRFDWAWGVEGHIVLPRVFYFSLGLDF